MVAADEGNLVGVPFYVSIEKAIEGLNTENLHGLQAHEKSECLETEIAAVDKVTQEDEVLVTIARHLVVVDANSRITSRAATSGRMVCSTGSTSGFFLIIIIAVVNAAI